MKKRKTQKKSYTFSSVAKAAGAAFLSVIKTVGRVLSPVAKKVGKVLSSAWNALLIKASELRKRFDSLEKEKQRYVAAGVVGGVAALLLLIALIVGLSSLSRPVSPKQPASDTKELQIQSDPSPAITPEAIDSTPSNEPVSTAEPVAISEPVTEDEYSQLKKHDSSPDVMDLQKALISLGYLEIDEPTEYYGSATEYAVKLFQRQHDLEQSGTADSQTLSLLYSKEAQHYALKQGAEGRDVKMVQEQLHELGYLGNHDIDSIYGDVTTAAIIAFQKRNGLSADGIAGEKTLDKLFSDEAKISKEKEAQEKAEKEKAEKEAKEKAEKEKAAEEAAKKKKQTSSTAKATPKPTPKQSSKEKRISRFIEAAKSKIGCEYVLGGRGPKTFDCSGLVYWCLKQAGVSTTRLSASGYSKKKDWKEITSYSNVEKGDILFFRDDDSSSVSHAGIYIGSGMMIDASSSNGKVVKRAVSSYWKSHFVNARRPW
ncbi:MAG: peptidoglycan-binding protein [Clostridia bacterium]|nr:peptidoglycan-binding protein [Clostridia bacterium]